MATQQKTYVSVVPFKDLCVACSVNSNSRYYIVRKSGQRGPTYALACEIYSTTFHCRDNYGTYVCKTCQRLLSRIRKTKKNLDKLSYSLEQNTQILRKSWKRVNVKNRTPNGKQNEVCLGSSKYKEQPPISQQRSSEIPNADKSSLCGSSVETATSQQDGTSNSDITAMNNGKDRFTIIKWERSTKTKFDGNTVITNTSVGKLANENVNSEKEIRESNTTDPDQNHPVKHEIIPMDRSKDIHKTTESALPVLASSIQPVVVLERIKVEPDLLVSDIPEEFGENMQEGRSENIGIMSLSQDSFVGTLLDKKTEECSIECSEQEIFLRSVPMPCVITDAPLETSQSEDGILASEVKNEDNGSSKEMEEEIRSVIQTNMEEMLTSEQTNAEMASQDSSKQLNTKTAINNSKFVSTFDIERRSTQKESSISSSLIQQVNGDKSSSCGSPVETATSQQDGTSNSDTTAMNSGNDRFTIIKWERVTKTKFHGNTCVKKNKVITNPSVGKLANENVNSEKEISDSNTTDPDQNHPVKHEIIPMDRSKDSHSKTESASPILASSKQPVIVLERIKVEPNLLGFDLPVDLGKNMQERCNENMGSLSLSQHSVAGTLLDKRIEECSIECSEQEVFLKSVTMPCSITDSPQETSQSEDGMLASNVKNENNGEEMEEEIQSVIQTNIEEMLISEQISKGGGFFPFACRQCNYTAKSQNSLKKHMETHMPERPLVCKICGRGFKNAYHLSGHKRTHLRKRPHSCEDCGRNFSYKSHLRRHQRTHLGVSERVQHKCHECGKSFFTAYSLRRHLQMHENRKKKVKAIRDMRRKQLTYNPAVDDPRRKYACDVCGRKFTRKEHVMRHMLTHTRGVNVHM